MLLHILSDIHIEFEPFEPPTTEADVVVLAGDRHVGTKGLEWAKDNFKDEHVIYVLGNHEYYGQALPKLTNKLKELSRGTNIHILENDKLEIDGVVFLGCTLWTDFKLFGDPRIAGYEASQKMTDFKKIRVSPSYRKLRSIDLAGIHFKSLNWLKNELDNNKGGKLVVVTHHSPSMRSIPNDYREDVRSAAFASNLDEFVKRSGAELWVHGHLHVEKDYMIGGTRVVCNPRGYPHEWNDEFLPGFVVEI